MRCDGRHACSIGKNIQQLIERPDGNYLFRLHKERVYYVKYVHVSACNSHNREDVLKRATNIERKKLIACGLCVGKFTHSRKFHLQITGLDILARHAVVW